MVANGLYGVCDCFEVFDRHVLIVSQHFVGAMPDQLQFIFIGTGDALYQSSKRAAAGMWRVLVSVFPSPNNNDWIVDFCVIQHGIKAICKGFVAEAVSVCGVAEQKACCPVPCDFFNDILYFGRDRDGAVDTGICFGAADNDILFCIVVFKPDIQKLSRAKAEIDQTVNVIRKGSFPDAVFYFADLFVVMAWLMNRTARLRRRLSWRVTHVVKKAKLLSDI